MLLSSQSPVRTVTCTLVVLSLASSLSAGAADNSQVQRGDAALVARQVVARLLTRFVCGRIDFDLDIEDTSSGKVISAQRGVLYINQPSGVRLDLWVPRESEAPIICTVHEGRVWTSWGSSPTIHESEYPVLVANPNGWLGQTNAQAGETIVMRHLLADFLLRSEVMNPIAATFDQDQLLISLDGRGAAAAPDTEGQPRHRLVAQYLNDIEAFFPVEIVIDRTTIQLSDFWLVDKETVVPRLMHVNLAVPSRRRYIVTVRDYVPMETDQVLAELRPPRERSDLENFPNPFAGTVLYDHEGRETFHPRAFHSR